MKILIEYFNNSKDEFGYVEISIAGFAEYYSSSSLLFGFKCLSNRRGNKNNFFTAWLSIVVLVVYHDT